MDLCRYHLIPIVGLKSKWRKTKKIRFKIINTQVSQTKYIDREKKEVGECKSITEARMTCTTTLIDYVS
jgi:hypothetical protein